VILPFRGLFFATGLFASALYGDIIMSPARPALRKIAQTFTRIIIQLPTTNLSKIDISYPSLLESVPPASYRYAIPLAISLGAFTYVPATVGPPGIDLMTTRTKDWGLRLGVESLVAYGTFARKNCGITVIK
jgi:hypothetical protein